MKQEKKWIVHQSFIQLHPTDIILKKKAMLKY